MRHTDLKSVAPCPIHFGSGSVPADIAREGGVGSFCAGPAGAGAPRNAVVGLGRVCHRTVFRHRTRGGDFGKVRGDLDGRPGAGG